MIKTKYVDRKHNIGFVNWNEAWLLCSPYPVKMLTEIYRGSLVFRIPGTSKRIGYKTLKNNLERKEIVIKEEPLPF
jgi:hypothetical protein